RVVAVGTTTVRALEHAARARAGEIVPGRGQTDLFITPGFHFQVADALLTNLHLPKSTLLMLVSAFAGKDIVFRAYPAAVTRRGPAPSFRLWPSGPCRFPRRAHTHPQSGRRPRRTYHFRPERGRRRAPNRPRRRQISRPQKPRGPAV